MNSKDKLEIVAKRMPKYGNKRWVWVNVRNRAMWIPSFHDLFRIVQAICFCEDEKYPDGEGRGMVERFLFDCCDEEADWDSIRNKYQIPNRDDDLPPSDDVASIVGLQNE